MDTTVNALLDRYVVEILPTLSERCRHDYERYHIPKLRELWGHRIADEIKPREFGEFLFNSMSGRIARTRMIAPLAHAYALGRGRWWMCETNPIQGVEKPKGQPRKHVIKLTELKAMIDAASPRLKLLMALAALTGQRQGDIVSLRWSQIHDGKIHFVQGKTGKEVNIALSPQLKRVLGKCFELERAKGCEDWVIVNRHGRPYKVTAVRAMYTAFQKQHAEAGHWRRACFHDLRRMNATLSGSLEEAKTRLGHDDAKMTTKHYRFVANEASALELPFNPI